MTQSADVYMKAAVDVTNISSQTVLRVTNSYTPFTRSSWLDDLAIC